MRDDHLDPDQVDRLIDDVLGDSSTPGGSPDAPAERIAMQRMRALAGEPLPEETRERHLATIRAREPVSAGTPRPISGWLAGVTRRLVPVTAAATLLLVAFAGTAVAVAQDADPDSALYGLKQTSEQVWLALPRGQERRAEVHLAIAERRMHEVARTPHHAEMLAAAAVSNIEAAADEKPEEAVQRLAELVREHSERMEAGHPGRGVAIAALHRNCLRIARHHGIATSDEALTNLCGPTPDVVHPGRGHGDGPRGWGAGGRPEGMVGPPPHSQGRGDDLDDDK
jgi:hypothetical protein